MADRYKNFAELCAAEREGIDFRIRVTTRNSHVAIIAPHGGTIEPTTSEIAYAIAKRDHSLYAFEGLLPNSYGRLHLTSTNFDEPQCLKLIDLHDRVVTVHGLKGDGLDIKVGGLDFGLRDAIVKELRAAKFNAGPVMEGPYAGRHEKNICNRGRSGGGVQLEIRLGLRDQLKSDRDLLVAFADASRRAIRGVQ